MSCMVEWGSYGACTFLNKHIGEDTISIYYPHGIVYEIIRAGRRLANKGRYPLMYEWHGKKYWGAAYGLAGIMHVLMDMELKPDEVEDFKGTLCYMIKNRFTGGNYPSSEGSESDRLVHWCHGAPWITLTLVKAAQVFGDEEFLQAVIWKRGLLMRIGICHGICRNTYVFLALHRLTGKVEYLYRHLSWHQREHLHFLALHQLTGKLEYLYRATAFACFLLDRAQKLISEGRMHGGDRPLFSVRRYRWKGQYPAYEL